MTTEESDMKLNEIERFEIVATAFYRMTGRLAPGKDSPAALPSDREGRSAAWEEWNTEHGDTVRAVLNAVESVLEPDR